MELLVATRNKKKLEEIKEILKDSGLEITSLIDYPNIPSVIEDGKTFRENAIKKAAEIAKLTKKLTLGEDSGLEVEALDRRPGIYSAGFAGEERDDLKNNLKLLKLLKGLPLEKRKAHYICSVALADKNGLIDVKRGRCSGLIGFELKGNFGFGYDPLFIISRYNKTFAQLGPEVKNKMSHRSRALKKLKIILKKYIEGK